MQLNGKKTSDLVYQTIKFYVRQTAYILAIEYLTPTGRQNTVFKPFDTRQLESNII